MTRNENKKLDEIIQRLDEQKSRIECLGDKLDGVQRRMDRAEKITQPANDIFQSAYEKLVYGLGWLVIVVMAAICAAIAHVFTAMDIFRWFK